MNETLHALVAKIIEYAQILAQDSEREEKQCEFAEIILNNAYSLEERFCGLQAIWSDCSPAKVRHDLGNSLTPLFGYTQLMLSGKVGFINDQDAYTISCILDTARTMREHLDNYQALAG